MTAQRRTCDLCFMPVRDEEMITPGIMQRFGNLRQSMPIGIRLDHSARDTGRLSGLNGAPIVSNIGEMNMGARSKAHGRSDYNALRQM